MRPLVLALFALAACSKAPLQKGDYTITLTSQANDTCNYDDATVGIGDTWDAVVAWDGDVLLLTNFLTDTSYDPAFDTQGNPVYHAQWDEETPINDVCAEESTITHELAVTDDGSFTIAAHLDNGEQGQGCATIENELPCTLDLTYEGVAK